MTSAISAPARERAARFDMLVHELHTIIRFADPELQESALRDEARLHATRRLAGADLVASFVA